MGVEVMKCCGALTRVYSDAGKRKHNPDCQWVRLNEAVLKTRELTGVDKPREDA